MIFRLIITLLLPLIAVNREIGLVIHHTFVDRFCREKVLRQELNLAMSLVVVILNFITQTLEIQIRIWPHENLVGKKHIMGCILYLTSEIVLKSDFFSNIIFKMLKKYKILKLSQKSKNLLKYAQ
jgi:hypothetical protein